MLRCERPDDMTLNRTSGMKVNPPCLGPGLAAQPRAIGGVGDGAIPIVLEAGWMPTGWDSSVPKLWERGSCVRLGVQPVRREGWGRCG